MNIICKYKGHSSWTLLLGDEDNIWKHKIVQESRMKNLLLRQSIGRRWYTSSKVCVEGKWEKQVFPERFVKVTSLLSPLDRNKSPLYNRKRAIVSRIETEEFLRELFMNALINWKWRLPRRMNSIIRINNNNNGDELKISWT